MEIHNNTTRINYIRKFRKRLGAKKILAIILIVFILSGFGFGCIVYGAYLNKTGQTTTLRMFLVRVVELDFSFINKNLKSRTTDIDNFSIDIKFKNWEKIRYYRKQAMISEGITSEMQEEIPAKIRYNGHVFSVDLSLTGMTVQHINHPYKWSLSVKVKNNETIMGMRRFALLFPQARGYLTDWIATKMLQSQNVIGLRSNFVNVTINGKDNGLYYLEERFDKRLVENNQFREGIVFKIENNDLKIYGLKKIMENEESSSQLTILKRMIHSFLTSEISANKIFDLKKFASIYVVSDIMNQKHALFPYNMRLYFNPITHLIEPIGREWGYLRKETQSQTSLSIEKPNPDVEYHVEIHKNDILNKLFNNFTFEEEYIKQASFLSNPKYLDDLINKNEGQIKELLNKIYKQNPFYIFPLDLLYKNQEYIRNKINPQLSCISVFIDNMNADSVFLLVDNKIDLPIEIHYVKFSSKNEFLPSERILIKSKYKTSAQNQLISIPLKNFIDLSDICSDSLEVYYSILGMSEIKRSLVYQNEMTEDEFANINPTMQPVNINEFSFIEIIPETKQIKFSEDKCDVYKDLIIPEGYTVQAKPGCQIDLTNSSRIISYSPIMFFGKKDSIINIISSDSTGQGMLVLNCDQTSELLFVNFNNLSNIYDIGWDLRGAVTFYESPVNINNCTFTNNIRGDDYLNILRTEFNILNTTFEKINADAFDSDFCTGTIENVRFIDIGNDAIDVSGTNLHIMGVDIEKFGDKGISGGEKSKLVCENINIANGEIAIASKDNSMIKLMGITINSSKIAYCAFQKKAEFGPGVIKVENANHMNINVEYLIEVGSSLTINGEQIIEKKDNVKEMLYGAEYGKSSK